VNQILLDTHAFLWFVFDDSRLSSSAAKTIEDARVTKLLSVVSLWEIVIKSQIGKLKLGMTLEDFFNRNVTKRELELVDIELRHLLAYDALPLVHRDPFDRLLAAKARVLNVPILSADSVFAHYDVKLVW
jgi:PIN domain nuclease of toxin-antitoxin system